MYLLLILAFAVLPLSAADKIKELVLAGPKSSVTHPMAYIVEKGLLNNVAENVKLVIWNNPDQVRSLIAGKQAHFSAVPSYVAATFYNKGVPVRLLNISAWGILYMVSSDPKVKTLADLKGETISMPYRNDMPDIVLKTILSKQGMNPDKDFKFNYHTSLPSVLQEVMSGKTKHGLLAEPLVSMALMKSKKLAKAGKASKLYRAVSLQKEWGKTFNRDSKIPQAGILATAKVLDRPDVINAFQKAYKEAIEWCNNNPEEAGKIVSKYIPGLKPKPIATALKNANITFVSAVDSRAELEYFYNILKETNPAKIGGKLPDDDFYWKAQEEKEMKKVAQRPSINQAQTALH